MTDSVQFKSGRFLLASSSSRSSMLTGRLLPVVDFFSAMAAISRMRFGDHRIGPGGRLGGPRGWSWMQGPIVYIACLTY